jgi:ATP-dependent protease ClpP protease subunit
MNGITLYNYLRALPVTLTIHNVGNVNSIGNAIFLAGARRYACQHSTFMFHGVGVDVPGPIRLEEKLLRGQLAAIDIEQKRIGSIILDRTKLNQSQVRRLFREAVTKDAAFAASCGIIDQIRDVQIPPGSTILSLVFQR